MQEGRRTVQDAQEMLKRVLLPPGESGAKRRMSIFRQQGCLVSIKELESGDDIG
jgi:hypothetical protein